MAEIRRTLQNLTQNTRYIVRARAINEFGVPSPWSEALDFTTRGDGSIPAEPTDLVLDFTTSNVLVSWDPASLNTDGTVLLDFRAYEVSFTVGPVSKSYLTTASHFIYSFQQNKLDFGSPQPEIIVSVVALDVSNNRSTALQGVATNAIPPDPTVPPALVTGFTMVAISIPGQPISDLDGYDIYHSSTVDGTYFLIASTTNGADNFVHAVSQASTHFYKYKVRDVFSQTSEGFSPTANTTTLATITEDAIAPDPIENFRVTANALDVNQKAYVELAWDPSEALDLAFYEIRYRRDADVVFSSLLKGIDFVTQRFDNLDVDTTYFFQIRASDVSGNLSEWAPVGDGLEVATVADTVPPAVPAGLAASSGVESITLRWDANSEPDLDHYELYAGDTAGFTPAVGNLLFSGNSSSFTDNVGSDVTRYYRLRALDHTGNASAYTAEASGTSYETFLRDLTPPAVPSGLALVTGSEIVEQVERSFITASWDANVETDFGGYQLQYKRTADAAYTSVSIPKGTVSHRVGGLLANQGYDFRIASYDWSVNVSAFSAVESITTPQDSTAPPVPANPRSTVALRTVTWAWDGVVAADFHHYEAQVATSGAFGTVLHTETGDSISFTWQGPNAGTTYYMRVRAVDVSENASAWSATASAQTTAVTGIDLDEAAPLTPTGLALTTGQEFNGLVENVYINAGWNTNSESDLAGYNLRIRKGVETRYQHVDIPLGNTSTKITGLQANTSYGAQVLAYDTFGNYSPYTAEVTITTSRDAVAPPVPANARSSVSLRAVTWAWNAVAAIDFATYEAQVSASAAFNVLLHVETGDSVSFPWQGADYGATYYMRVRSIDVSGNTSAWSATASATTATVIVSDLSTTVPAVPTGLALTTGQEFNGQVENVYVNATWNENSEPDLQGYNLRLRKGTETRYTHVAAPKGAFSAKFTGLAPNTSYGVQIQAYTSFGNYSAYSTEVTVTTAKDAGIPATPGGVVLVAAIRSLILTWTANTEVDFDHYEIHVGTAPAFTASAANLYSKPAQGTIETISRYWTGTVWADVVPGTAYHVKMYAVDVSGNRSGASTEVTATTGYLSNSDVLANTVTADKITTSTLNATITVSGTIRTATGGARMEMTSAGQIGYATDGVTKNFEYKNSDGSVTLKGALTSGSTITGSIMTGSTFQTNGTPTTDGVIIEDTNGFRAFQAGVLNAQISRLGVFTFRKGSILAPASDVSFTIGSGASIFKVDASGLYLGSATFASAPFRVDYLGHVVATDIDLVGGTISGAFNVGTSSSGRLRLGATTDAGARIAMTKDWFRAFGTGSTSDTTAKTFEIDRATGSVTIDGTVAGGGLTVIGGTITAATFSGSTFQTNATPTTNGIIIEDTNGFRAFAAGVLNAQISRLGVFTLRKGAIVGPSTDVSFAVGSASTIFKVDSSGLYLGSATFASAPFRSDYSGNVTASSIDLAGGTISGAFNVGTTSSGRLRLGATSDAGARITLTKDFIKAFSSGSSNDTTGVLFWLDRLTSSVTIGDGTTGALSVAGGTITGGTIVGGTMTIGTSPNWFKADATGIWLGGTSFGNANFSVANTGQMIAKKLSIDTTGMTATDIIINSSSLVVTAGGTVASRNLQASTGRIGDVQISSSASTYLTTQATSGATTLIVTDASAFAASGTVTLGTQAGAVTYGGKTATTLISVTGVTATHPVGTLVQQAGKLVAGTIEGSTINVQNSGSINFTGSGNMTWLPGATGGITVSNSGYVRSGNYATPAIGNLYAGAGWRVGATGVEIYQGTIKAAALQIGVSTENLLRNSSFENYTYDPSNQDGLADWWVPIGAASHTFAQEPTPPALGSSNTRFQNYSQKVTAAGVAMVGVEQTLTVADGTLPDILPAGSWVSLSCWIKAPTTRTARISVVDVTNGSGTYPSSSQTLTSGTYTRVTHSVFIGSGATPISTLKFQVWAETPAAGEIYYFEGAQLELSSWVSPYHPKTLEIPDNYIQGAFISQLGADKITTGTLTATQVVTVGSGAYIQSFNYSATGDPLTAAGYQLSYDNLTFQNGSINLIGIGAAGSYGGVSLDANSLRAVYGVTTQLQVDSTGVFIGGSSAANADMYVDTANDKVVFQSVAPGATAKFEINSNANAVGLSSDAIGKVMRLYTGTSPNTLDSFYLTTDGMGYFAKGVIGSTLGAGSNRIKNSSFETIANMNSVNAFGLDNWTAFVSGGTFTTGFPSRGTPGLYGGFSCDLRWTSAGDHGLQQTPAVGAISGAAIWPASSVWTLSFWIAQTGTMGLPSVAFAAPTGLTATALDIPLVSNMWRRYIYRITVDPTDRTSDLRVYFTHTPGQILMDGVQLERGEIATPFAPMPEEVDWKATTPLTTSDVIRTGLSGARMEMSGSGLIGYALDGFTKNLEYRNSDGYMMIRGEINANSGTFTNSIVVGSGAGNLIRSAGSEWYIRGDGYANFSNADINGRVQITASGNTMQFGRDVGPGSGHHGLSLSSANFNNIFIRRASDNVVFFRVNAGGSGGALTFEPSGPTSGTLTVTGTISGSFFSGGSININNCFQVNTNGDTTICQNRGLYFGQSAFAGSFFNWEGGGSNRVVYHAGSYNPPYSMEMQGRILCSGGLTAFDNLFCNTGLYTKSVYDNVHRMFWHSGIDGMRTHAWGAQEWYNYAPDATLVFQSDGNVVLYDNGGVWHMKGIPSAMHLKQEVRTYQSDAMEKVRALRPVSFKRKYDDKRAERRVELNERRAVLAALLAAGGSTDDHEDEPAPRAAREVELAEKMLANTEERWEQRHKPSAQTPEIGFIAEEVAEIEPALVLAETEGVPASLLYGQFTALLTKAMQELDARIAAIEDRSAQPGH